MNKVIITIITIIVIIGSIFAVLGMLNTNKEKMLAEEEAKNEISVSEQDEEIYDECTDEYEAIKTETINANAQQEKTSPNCTLLVKTYFKTCEHTTNTYLDLPEHLVNLSKEEIQSTYPDYTIQSFSNNEIILYQEREGECGQHFLVKDNEGIVTIYKILEDGTLKEQQATSIDTEYLPETDKMSIKEGIKVNGRQNLNQLIEDFE